MNTSSLKRFAQQARRKLLTQVAARLELVLNTDSAELRDKSSQLRKLREEINRSSKALVIDKVAYTWFNRLMALRFMDVNDYQPLNLRVVTPRDGYTLPEILQEAKQGHIPDDLSVNRQHIFDLLDGRIPAANAQNEAYKELLIGACNHLHQVFPFMFERINDYTELLLPDDLTSGFSIVHDIREGMQPADCTEVEIIGWLYQFYISERKDEVFASKEKVKKEDIPAATQLFTPRWIVEFMVQNTLGKLWLQNRPNSKLRQHMPYYIETPGGQSDDFLKLYSIEEIHLLDQAAGSGHILVYAFELLARIYEEEGYNTGEIPALILRNNLFGFEIDGRAAQLASFALMMKARNYDRQAFRKNIVPGIVCFEDFRLRNDELNDLFRSKGLLLNESIAHDFNNMRQATNIGSLIIPETPLTELEKFHEILSSDKTPDAFLSYTIRILTEALKQLTALARKYHCVVDNPPYMGGGNMNKELGDFVKKHYPDSKSDLMACFMESGLNMLHPKGFMGMINQHSWMFLSSYEALRKKLIENAQIDTLLHLGPRTFPEIGGEVVQNASFTLENVKSYKKGAYIRLVDDDQSELKRTKTLEAIPNPNCDWIFFTDQNNFIKIPGSLIGYWVNDKFLEIFRENKMSDFGDSCIGMRTGNNLRFLRFWHETIFENIGLDNDNASEAQKSSQKWFPYCKGGTFRKWYGNNDYVVNWENDGYEIKENTKLVYPQLGDNLGWKISNEQYYFKPGLTWSGVGASIFGVRSYPKGMLFDSGANSYFVFEQESYYYFAGLLNSSLINSFINIINPTINTGCGVISILPAIFNSQFFNTVNRNVERSIKLSLADWDSSETSWDFRQNELIRCKLNCGQNCADLDMLDDEEQEEILAIINVPTDSNLLEHCYEAYQSEWKRSFFQLHQNEEELNRQFIEIYGLQEELTPDVPLEEITILQQELDRAALAKLNKSLKREPGTMKVLNYDEITLPFNAKEVMAQFVSYAVGCMFGRYSLDKEGLILANQGETIDDFDEKVIGSRAFFEKTDDPYQANIRYPNITFMPDDDNIIPVLDEEWFEDDIVNRFHKFLKVTFGEENFSQNLAFLEDSLSKDIRKYFLKDFYADHIKRYKKRPIYWQFSSPKGSFNVLIYMHRYTPDTINLILNKYLRQFQEKLRNQIEQLEHVINTGTPSEQNKATKEKDKLKHILIELQEYERDVIYPLATERIPIDLDDGVLVNYNKFGRAVKEVTGLNDKATKEKVRGFDWIDGAEIR
jgi:hypothetical protein